jgi:hypothetical protein
MLFIWHNVKNNAKKILYKLDMYVETKFELFYFLAKIIKQIIKHSMHAIQI